MSLLFENIKLPSTAQLLRIYLFPCWVITFIMTRIALRSWIVGTMFGEADKWDLVPCRELQNFWKLFLLLLTIVISQIFATIFDTVPCLSKHFGRFYQVVHSPGWRVSHDTFAGTRSPIKKLFAPAAVCSTTNYDQSCHISLLIFWAMSVIFCNIFKFRILVFEFVQ